MNVIPWPEFLAKAPLSDAVRKDIARVYTEKKDYLAGMSVEEKAGPAEQNQLRGILDEALQADTGSPAVFPDVYTRSLLHWH